MTDPLKSAMSAVERELASIPDRPTVEQVRRALQPTDNPKKAFGDTKPSLHFVPMRPMLEVAEVMRHGAEKYGLRNWRQQSIKTSTYFDAMMRHLLAWYEDLQDTDTDSQRAHLAHLVCNALIVLDATEQNSIIDDRDQSEVSVR